MPNRIGTVPRFASRKHEPSQVSGHGRDYPAGHDTAPLGRMLRSRGRAVLPMVNKTVVKLGPEQAMLRFRQVVQFRLNIGSQRHEQAEIEQP